MSRGQVHGHGTLRTDSPVEGSRVRAPERERDDGGKHGFDDVAREEDRTRQSRFGKGKTGDESLYRNSDSVDDNDAARDTRSRGAPGAWPRAPMDVIAPMTTTPKIQPSRYPADGPTKTPAPPRPPDKSGRPISTSASNTSTEAAPRDGPRMVPASITPNVCRVIGTAPRRRGSRQVGRES